MQTTTDINRAEYTATPVVSRNLRAGGQGLYLRSLDHLGRSSEAKYRKKTKKLKCDERNYERMDRRIDGLKKQGVESRSTRLKIFKRVLFLSAYFSITT